MTGEEMEEGIYMLRRKFYIPKKEMVRDYYRKDLTPSDFILECDYNEDKDDE